MSVQSQSDARSRRSVARSEDNLSTDSGVSSHDLLNGLDTSVNGNGSYPQNTQDGMDSRPHWHLGPSTSGLPSIDDPEPADVSSFAQSSATGITRPSLRQAVSRDNLTRLLQAQRASGSDNPGLRAGSSDRDADPRVNGTSVDVASSSSSFVPDSDRAVAGGGSCVKLERKMSRSVPRLNQLIEEEDGTSSRRDSGSRSSRDSWDYTIHGGRSATTLRPMNGATKMGVSSLSQSSSNLTNMKAAASAVLAMRAIKDLRVDQARDHLTTGHYLSGPSGSNHWINLLGAEELRRHFPTRKVRVFVGTWNMGGCRTSEVTLHHWLLPPGAETLPDLYFIGVQEGPFGTASWYQLWEVSLQRSLGFSHVLFHSVYLGAQHLSIFVRRELIWFLSVPRDSHCSTRVVSQFKTKGATAVAFKLFGTRFLAINCHFSAHDDSAQLRLADAAYILRTLKFGQKTGVDWSEFDAVFWFGDFNFRLNSAPPALNGPLFKQQLSALEPEHALTRALEAMDSHDEYLHLCKNRPDGFFGFEEHPVRFMPSYKYDVGTNTLDSSSKNRIPAFTDRVLYRAKHHATVTVLQYNSVPDVVNSDHKPVFAIADVVLKSGRDRTVLAAGKFDRNVYQQALGLATPKGKLSLRQSSSKVSLISTVSARKSIKTESLEKKTGSSEPNNTNDTTNTDSTPRPRDEPARAPGSKAVSGVCAIS